MRNFFAFPTILFIAVLMQVAPTLAQDSLPLKMDTPKIDSHKSDAQKQESAPSETQNKGKAPLRGKIEKNTQPGLSGSATSGMGHGDTGKGNLNKRAGINTNNLFNTQVQSGIGIIGVKFVMYLGRPPIINRVFPQTPAAISGIKINDVIMAVDGIPTRGLSKEEVYDMIVGTPGTQVTLTIMRHGDYIPINMTRMDLNDITDPFIKRDYMLSL